VTEYLDTFIVQQGLSQDQRQKIPYIHIADTNWNDGDKDIHFCVYYNPCSQSIQFGMTYDDDSALMPTSVSDWVTGQEWRLFRVGVNDITT
jgi:hypothetical protein